MSEIELTTKPIANTGITHHKKLHYRMKTKAWKLQRLQAKRMRRTYARRRHRRNQKRLQFSIESHARRITRVEFNEGLNRYTHTLSSPRDLDLQDNYNATIAFLNRVRQAISGIQHGLVIDLKDLKVISPAAALLLVAELDRWRETTRTKRLNTVEAEKWDPNVTMQLHQLGFFDLLGAEIDTSALPDSSQQAHIKFLRGHQSLGEAARKLRMSIEDLGLTLSEPGALYDGLVEAMTNVRHHAYPSSRHQGRWWMSASVDKGTNQLTVMFLDHGQGIPTSLPRSRIWPDVNSAISKIGSLGGMDHGNLIKAAITAKRTRTGDLHRGNGLRDDIQGYVEKQSVNGALRIYSNYGYYKFTKEEDNREASITKRLPRHLQGTFLEWRIMERRQDEQKSH